MVDVLTGIIGGQLCKGTHSLEFHPIDCQFGRAADVLRPEAVLGSESGHYAGSTDACRCMDHWRVWRSALERWAVRGGGVSCQGTLLSSLVITTTN
jgi:hypothetical protein